MFKTKILRNTGLAFVRGPLCLLQEVEMIAADGIQTHVIGRPTGV